MKTSVILLLFLAIAPLAQAATVEGRYALGEAGSVGAPPAYTSLVDSEGTPNNIAGSQLVGSSPDGVASLLTSGLAAPGSTAALNLVQPVDRNAGWFMTGGGFGLTDDWALELWFRPADVAGANDSFIFAATDGSANGVSLELNNGRINLLAGNDTSSRVVGPAYTTGTWYKLNLSDNANQVSLSVNDLAAITDVALTGSTLDFVRLGFGPAALGGRGADGAYDEMLVINLVPEPSVPFLLGGAAVVFGFMRRRRARD